MHGQGFTGRRKSRAYDIKLKIKNSTVFVWIIVDLFIHPVYWIPIWEKYFRKQRITVIHAAKLHTRFFYLHGWWNIIVLPWYVRDRNPILQILKYSSWIIHSGRFYLNLHCRHRKWLLHRITLKAVGILFVLLSKSTEETRYQNSRKPVFYYYSPSPYLAQVFHSPRVNSPNSHG